MAVVQISRIQIRRGRKNQGSGLPQLASGEFGWAVDTQELFIGNGSVAEGAPYVGNTQILTENSNLFQLADTYTYREDDSYIQTGATTSNPVVRTLQERLDDRVSVRAFGCPGDGSDQTAALQRAIFQLFLNDANKTNPQSRHVLYVEPGTYTISSTIYLPPYTTIVGAGKGKTVFNITGYGTAFKTINGLSTPETVASDALTTESNQARYIRLENFTVSTSLFNVTCFQLENCTRSSWKSIEMIGPWRHGYEDTKESAGFHLNALGTLGVTSSYNQFDDVTVNGFAYHVYSKYDVINNDWTNCEFTNGLYGVHFGVDTILGSSGQLTGPSGNSFSNSIFNDISREAIIVQNGLKNLSSGNKFYLVGNNGGSSASPLYPVISFGNSNNLSNNDWFQRSSELGYDLEYLYNVPFVPEVAGPVFTDHGFTQHLQISELNEYTKLFKFPAETYKGLEIEYLYKSNQIEAVRKGTLTVTVNPFSDEFLLSDNFDFVGDSANAENLRFQAQSFDEDGDTVVDTVAIMVLNSTSSDDGDLYFRVKTRN